MIHPLSQLPLQNHAKCHKIEDFKQIQEIINPEGILNQMIGSKVNPILPD